MFTASSTIIKWMFLAAIVADFYMNIEDQIPRKVSSVNHSKGLQPYV
jgi:hypothetical protein